MTANTNTLTNNPAVVDTELLAAQTSTNTGFVGAMIPILVVLFIVSVLSDMFNWRQRVSRWVMENYGNYWREKHRRWEAREEARREARQERLKEMGEVDYDLKDSPIHIERAAPGGAGWV